MKKLLAIVLSVAMVLGAIGTVTFAAEIEGSVTEAVTIGESTTISTNITVGETITISGDVTISGGGTITRAEGMDKPMFSVGAGSTLTLENITIDGGAVWTYEVSEDEPTYIETVLERGTVNTGVVANAAVISNSGKVIVGEGAIIENNDGGVAVTAANGSTTAIDGGIIRNITAGAGSAVLAGDTNTTASIEMKNGKICGNLSGGGSAFWHRGPVTVGGGEICNNYSTGVAGVFRMATGSNLSVTINGGKIHHNEANGAGGVIYGYGTGKVTINGGEISDNKAIDGGAIYYEASRGTEVTLNDGLITRNYASETGGAMHLKDWIYFTMNGGEISENSTDGLGGALRQWASWGTSFNGGVVKNNTAAEGEAIWMGNGLFIGKTTFENNDIYASQYIRLLNEDFSSFELSSGVPVTSAADSVGFYIIPNDNAFVMTLDHLARIGINSEDKYLYFDEKTKEIQVLEEETAEEKVALLRNGSYLRMSSLDEAIEKATDTDVVVLLCDIDLDGVVSLDKKLTFDLNGYKITAPKSVFKITGDVTVTDSSDNKTGSLVSGWNAIEVQPNGVFTLDSGNIVAKNNGIYVSSVASSDKATININGGTINCEIENSAVMYLTQPVKVTITGGEMEGYNGILLWKEADITMTGGSINGRSYTGIQPNGSNDQSDIKISGSAKVSGYRAGIYHPSGKLTISDDAVISGGTGIVHKGGDLTVNGGTVTGNGEYGEFTSVNSGFADTGDGLYVEHFDDSEKEENYGTPTVSITGGKFTSVNNQAVASYAKDDLEPIVGFISGGSYSSDVSAYLAEGYDVARTADGYMVIAEEYQADSISIEYKDVTVEGTEGEKTYEIVVKANDEDKINDLASVDLSFAFTTNPVTGGAMDITVAPASDFTMTRYENTNRYMFNYNGVDAVEGTANAITVGTITVTGYGKYTIATDKADTNIVNATTVNDNLVDSYTAAGAEDDDVTTGALIINTDSDTTDDMYGKITDGDIAVPTRTLTVNVTFPNVVNDNAVAYQNMTVEITGNIDGVNKTVTYNLGTGSDAVAMTNGGAYVVTEDKLVLNNAYTVTVKGAGYRTARYTVTMTGNKTLNFWNNVMDNELEVEEGKATSAVTKNFLAGDIVGDNNINIYDLSAVVSYFGTSAENKAEAWEKVKYDLNRDGVIDSKDGAVRNFV